MSHGDVLVVDDMETNLHVATSLLKPYGFHIETAMSGQEAIALIKAGKVYDAIFIDHMMPEMDGIEATKHIRDLGYKNPIIALTANAVAVQADVFMQNGFDEFISKPIDIRQLDLVLNNHLPDLQSQGGSEISCHQAELDDVQEESSLVTAAVKGLDVSKGIKLHGGDKKTYYTVLRSYAADARVILERIEKVTDKDIEDYKLMVHSLKGASQSLFAEHVGNLAGDLEIAAAENDLEFIKNNNAVFLETAWELINDINAFFSAMEEESPKLVKDKPDESMLIDLLAACKLYDMNTADKIMDEIDEFKYDSDDGLSLWLRHNIDVMNYKEIDAGLSVLLNL